MPSFISFLLVHTMNKRFPKDLSVVGQLLISLLKSFPGNANDKVSFIFFWTQMPPFKKPYAADLQLQNYSWPLCLSFSFPQQLPFNITDEDKWVYGKKRIPEFRLKPLQSFNWKITKGNATGAIRNALLTEHERVEYERSFANFWFWRFDKWGHHFHISSKGAEGSRRWMFNMLCKNNTEFLRAAVSFREHSQTDTLIRNLQGKK